MSGPVDVLAVLDEAIEDCAWLRKNSTKTMEVTPEQLRIVRDAVAELIEQRDALRGALDRIVWYYDATQRNGRLPSMHSQAECQHESTMFGEARAVLAKCGGAK